MDKTYELSNGTAMPLVGYGTWRITPDEAADKTVRTALDMGYRHVDTAKIYGNERGVGKAVRESGIPREEIFVTTKLWGDDQPYDKAMRAIDESLARLGLEYVDLYLIHWPTEMRTEAWRAMQDIYRSGKAKAVGVSNYTVRDLKELLDTAEVAPMVNQVEFDPFIYENQKELLSYCREHDIVVQAYSPLARHSRDVSPEIEKIAMRLGNTPSQVILRWCAQHGTAPLPRSANPQHIRENLDIFEFELSETDMETIDALSDS
jgi:diketogulonate reductase-like aldo/keto reductase